MNIAVIGLGEVGRHLLGVLDKEGHDIIAVDQRSTLTSLPSSDTVLAKRSSRSPAWLAPTLWWR